MEKKMQKLETVIIRGFTGIRVSQSLGYLLGGPHMHGDHYILGSILAFPYLGELPYVSLEDLLVAPLINGDGTRYRVSRLRVSSTTVHPTNMCVCN